jgi:uncharacterized Rmd1/YagE family protein
LDTPDDLPNEELIRSLYRDVYEYLEVQERLGIMHDRFEIVRDMLELCRSVGQHAHAEFLEKIIIVLIVACGVVALFQVFYEFFY